MGKQTWKAGNMLYPVPAVMVSCQREGEKPNIITVAWAGTVCTSPAMVSISVRPERYSYDIIKETKEFVINLVTKDLVYATDYCGVRSGRDVDKFKEMKLTPQESVHVNAPSIKESPVNIECKLVDILEYGSHHMFVAEVVAVTVEDSLMDEKGKFELGRAGLVAYSHGEYFELGEKVGKFGFSVSKKNEVSTKKIKKDTRDVKDKKDNRDKKDTITKKIKNEKIEDKGGKVSHIRKSGKKDKEKGKEKLQKDKNRKEDK
ncbi:MAG: flavin reductase family protein [Lachnospiraceae bacterium]|nr:flavin reductase family protein [Lachnospiraceae bacterium]